MGAVVRCLPYAGAVSMGAHVSATQHGASGSQTRPGSASNAAMNELLTRSACVWNGNLLPSAGALGTSPPAPGADPGEGARLRRCLSAMVTAGIAAGYLTAQHFPKPRLPMRHTTLSALRR
jgi:hypothetical protein